MSKRFVLMSDLPKEMQAIARKKLKERKRKSSAASVLRKKAEAARRETFFAMLRRSSLPMPEAEFQFHPTRKWKMDFAWPDHKVALELEGAVWTQGRHTRGSGYVGDMEKYSEAAIAGWCVIRVQPSELTRLRTEEWLKRAIRSRNESVSG